MSQRDDVVKWLRWGVANEGAIHYSEGGDRMEGIGHPGKLPLHADCSSWWTVVCNWAGVDDPNGLGYNGYGYTGTQWQHLRQVVIAAALPGDGIIYGPYPGSHVAVVVEPGPDPLLISHGQERGPIYIHHSAEDRAHGYTGARAVRLLADLLPPPPIPPDTPEEEMPLTPGDIAAVNLAATAAAENALRVMFGVDPQTTAEEFSKAFNQRIELLVVAGVNTALDQRAPKPPTGP